MTGTYKRSPLTGTPRAASSQYGLTSLVNTRATRAPLPSNEQYGALHLRRQANTAAAQSGYHGNQQSLPSLPPRVYSHVPTPQLSSSDVESQLPTLPPNNNVSDRSVHVRMFQICFNIYSSY